MKTFNPFATSNFLLLHQIFRPFLPQIRLGLWNTASIWHTAVQSPLSGAVIDAHVSIQRYFLIANIELITVWVFFPPYWIVKLSHSYQATHELTNVFIPSCIWYLSLFIIFMGSTFTYYSHSTLPSLQNSIPSISIVHSFFLLFQLEK